MSRRITQEELNNCFLALAIARVALKANAGISQALSLVSASEKLVTLEKDFEWIASKIQSRYIRAMPEDGPSDD